MQPNNLSLIRTELSSIKPQRNMTDAQPEDDLFCDMAMDSLDIHTLANGLEIKLGIELSDSTIGSWRTVGDVVGTISKYEVI